jgi:hypothetical protein
MRVRKRYQNGGGVPGGDPKRQAEQLAFAQLLQDEAFKKKLDEKMRLRDEYGVYADDPAGLPSTDPFLALTAAGDAEAIGSGVAEMAGGDLLTGAGNVLLGAASVAIPGTLPKIKNIRGVEVTKRDPSKNVIADMAVEDDAGKFIELGKIDRSGRYVEGDEMFEPLIEARAARTAEKKDTNEMLDAVPIGGKVGSSSLSTDSYAIVLSKWAKGQLSAKKFDDIGGDNMGRLNRMGQKYKNSPEVEEWHRRRYDGNEDVIGYDERDVAFDNMYAPAQQMDFQEFVQVDPAARKAYQGGNTKKAEQLYDRYMIQSDNDLGISSFGSLSSDARLSREEAQEMVNIFNMKMRPLAEKRPAKQERLLKRGDNQSKAKLSDDFGIPPAQVVESTDFPGFYNIEYPQIPFHRNFEYGGKFKIKKKRKPGMQVKR